MAGESAKRRKRRPKGKPDNPAQSKRFIEAARKMGVDEESLKTFEGLLRSLAKHKPKGGSS